jgi:hypothetical protein
VIEHVARSSLNPHSVMSDASPSGTDSPAKPLLPTRAAAVLAGREQDSDSSGESARPAYLRHRIESGSRLVMLFFAIQLGFTLSARIIVFCSETKLNDSTG